MITTCFLYFTETLSADSAILKSLISTLNSQGFSVKLKDVKATFSTVVLLDIYGSVDESQLVSICAKSVTAIALDDGITSTSVDPDETGNVHIHPQWQTLSTDAHPPEEIVLLDYDVKLSGTPKMCNAHSKNGSNCKNRTVHFKWTVLASSTLDAIYFRF